MVDGAALIRNKRVMAISIDSAEELARSIIRRSGDEALDHMEEIIREAEEDGDLVGCLSRWREARMIIIRINSPGHSQRIH